MNKPIYLGLSKLELNKILMYEFWYDYVKLKCGEKNKIMFFAYRQFHISNDELDRPLPKGKKQSNSIS